jgi:hypothetical protein
VLVKAPGSVADREHFPFARQGPRRRTKVPSIGTVSVSVEIFDARRPDGFAIVTVRLSIYAGVDIVSVTEVEAGILSGAVRRGLWGTSQNMRIVLVVMRLANSPEFFAGLLVGGVGTVNRVLSVTPPKFPAVTKSLLVLAEATAVKARFYVLARGGSFCTGLRPRVRLKCIGNAVRSVEGRHERITRRPEHAPHDQLFGGGDLFAARLRTQPEPRAPVRKPDRRFLCLSPSHPQGKQLTR